MDDKWIENLSVGEFKKSVFALKTRKLGTFVEYILSKMIKELESVKCKQCFDLINKNNGERIEVKSSVICKKNNKIIGSDNLKIIKLLKETCEDKVISFNEWKNFKWDSNIQQIKKSLFDILYYIVFFSDTVKIFKISSNDIDSKINYSNKQHRNNEGEGQFHITNDNFQIHLDNYLYTTIIYEDLLKILKGN